MKAENKEVLLLTDRIDEWLMTTSLPTKIVWSMWLNLLHLTAAKPNGSTSIARKN